MAPWRTSELREDGIIYETISSTRSGNRLLNVNTSYKNLLWLPTSHDLLFPLTPFLFILSKLRLRRQASIRFHSFRLHRPHKQSTQCPCTWVGTCFHQRHRSRMRSQSRLVCTTQRRCQNRRTGRTLFHGYHWDYVRIASWFSAPKDIILVTFHVRAQS
jgi:hypothetical protein